jgi:Creatinase/Prolidase N-terminal domain.
MEKIKKLKQHFKKELIDGYLIPKNDQFFGEYVSKYNDRLNYITNFSGSYGLCLILKKNNYLFVDGRYTLQAKNQSGKLFKVITLPIKDRFKFLRNRKLRIGYDPKLYTYNTLNILFKKTNCEFKPVTRNLVDKIGKENKKK